MPDRYVNGFAPGAEAPAAPVTLLLVEADGGRAERIERHLTGAVPGLVATRCGTLASARAYLSGTAFDAVCTAEELPDGSGAALLELRDALGLRAPVFVRVHDGGRRPARSRLAGASCFVLPGDDAAAAAAIGRVLGKPCAAMPEEASGATAGSNDAVANGDAGGEVSVLLEALRAETGAVAHAINNPLTVIAGNAQFLAELARMGGVDPSLARPIEDIETAAQQLSEALGRLALLRQRIAASLGVADRL
jgi:hypothetical protein